MSLRLVRMRYAEHELPRDRRVLVGRVGTVRLNYKGLVFEVFNFWGEIDGFPWIDRPEEYSWCGEVALEDVIALELLGANLKRVVLRSVMPG